MPHEARTMENKWYYGRKGQQFGPFSDHQLKQLAASGQLLQTDMVWQKGMAQWVKAGQIKGLFSPPSTPAQQPVSVHGPTEAPQALPPKEQETDFDIGSWTSSAPISPAKTPSSLRHRPKKKSNPIVWIAVVAGGVVVVAGLAVAMLLGQFSTNGKKDMARSNGNGSDNRRSDSPTSSEGRNAGQASDSAGNGTPAYQKGYRAGVKIATDRVSHMKAKGIHPQVAEQLRQSALKELSEFEDTLRDGIRDKYQPTSIDYETGLVDGMRDTLEKNGVSTR